MEHNHTHHHHHDDHHHDIAIPEDRQAVCIVTGDIFDIQAAKAAGHYADYAGQTYFFCCATCLRLFKAEPVKYIHSNHQSTSLTLAAKENLADNVWAFRFTLPQPLTWVPGQFIRVELPHEQPDTEGTKRWFTISSTPHDGYLQITTRITDTTFKQALHQLAVGDTIKLVEKPDGNFVWREDENPLVLIAGGIGITPFYSMLKARGHSGQAVAAILIYNGRDDKLPFMAEFAEASKRHPELRVHYVIGKQLTARHVAELVPELTSSQVYISGPEPMVESLAAQLERVGVDQSRLHQDFFPNYSETDY